MKNDLTTRHRSVCIECPFPVVHGNIICNTTLRRYIVFKFKTHTKYEARSLPVYLSNFNHTINKITHSKDYFLFFFLLYKQPCVTVSVPSG